MTTNRLLNAFRGGLRRALNVDVKHVRSLYPWQIGSRHGNTDPDSVPAEAAAYLRWDNPRLVELKERYARVDPRVTKGTVWDEEIGSLDLGRFRSDNLYVFQERVSWGNELSYGLSWYAGMAGAEAPYLTAFEEDGLFGAYTTQAGGVLVSRDLLDSAGEVRFLAEHVDLGNTVRRTLDIGAGYGRLPHRLATAFPALEVLATDAVPTSTFLCEYYLAFRRSTARAVPLDEVEQLLATTPVDLATNIHSFSECTVPAIEWWVERLAAARVRYLMVIPNRNGTENRCLTNLGEDMEAIFERFGYRLRVRQRRYGDELLHRWGVDPCVMSLFELA